MELKMPTTEQAYWGLRAMKTVAMADGALDDAERQMLTSIQTILGTNHPVESLVPVTPEELASALTDRQIRHQLLQGLIVVSLIDGHANARETEMVEQFAQALNVNAPEVRDLRYLLNGEIATAPRSGTAVLAQGEGQGHLEARASAGHLQIRARHGRAI